MVAGLPRHEVSHPASADGAGALKRVAAEEKIERIRLAFGRDERTREDVLRQPPNTEVGENLPSARR